MAGVAGAVFRRTQITDTDSGNDILGIEALNEGQVIQNISSLIFSQTVFTHTLTAPFTNR